MIRAKCPGCAKLLGIEDSKAGSAVKCPACGRPFKVPPAERAAGSRDAPASNPASARSESGEIRPARPAASRSRAPSAKTEEPEDVLEVVEEVRTTPKPKPRPRPQEENEDVLETVEAQPVEETAIDEDEEDVERPRKRKSSRKPRRGAKPAKENIVARALDHWTVRVGMVVLILGGILGYLGYQEHILARVSSPVPENISLANLVARGPEGNANVLISDFLLCENYIYESKTTSSGYWEKVWIPVIPRQGMFLPGQPVRTNNIQALVLSKHVHNEFDMRSVLDRPTLQGMVINKIQSLGSQERNKLQEAYPGTDFTRCLIIEEGRTPSGQRGLMFLWGGAALALVIGGALIGLGFWFAR